MSLGSFLIVPYEHDELIFSHDTPHAVAHTATYNHFGVFLTMFVYSHANEGD